MQSAKFTRCEDFMRPVVAAALRTDSGLLINHANSESARCKMQSSSFRVTAFTAQASGSPSHLAPLEHASQASHADGPRVLG